MPKTRNSQQGPSEQPDCHTKCNQLCAQHKDQPRRCARPAARCRRAERAFPFFRPWRSSALAAMALTPPPHTDRGALTNPSARAATWPPARSPGPYRACPYRPKSSWRARAASRGSWCLGRRARWQTAPMATTRRRRRCRRLAAGQRALRYRCTCARAPHREEGAGVSNQGRQMARGSWCNKHTRHVTRRGTAVGT
eukprot:4177516-Prymnesium_polylepis.2